MLVVECDCGNEVGFEAPKGSTSPLDAECDDCGQRWRLSVRKVM